MERDRADIFTGEPRDTREEILKATYTILREDGFSGISMQRLADEVNIKKASLYYHFDGKDDVMRNFVNYVVGHLVEGLPSSESENAQENLQSILDFVLLGVLHDDGDTSEGQLDLDFAKAYMEFRAQAAHNATYRAVVTEGDNRIRDRITEIIRDGVEEGVFREVEPEQVAEFILYVVSGTIFRTTTTDGEALSSARVELDEYITNRLVKTAD